MKEPTREIGARAEQSAMEYLQKQGYEILERNWRFSRAEIDLIARDGDILVFVEVKYRSYDWYGPPEVSVDADKEHMIIDAAQRYMEKIGHEWEIRFDIVSILMAPEGKGHSLNHFKDAFF